jgi:ABC-type multidrug transport system fused ATPase/permease subunit
LGSTGDHRLFSIFTGLFEFFADLCLCLGAWKASVMLHNYMAGNVFRNPMRFFDATPTGRILSRFSSDVEVIDNLSQQISDTVYCFMDVRYIFFHYVYLLTVSLY